MTSKPTIIVTAPEHRQIAREMKFTGHLVDHVNWDKVATTARELGAHFEARFEPNGDLTITFFWSYRPDELDDDANYIGTSLKK